MRLKTRMMQFFFNLFLLLVVICIPAAGKSWAAEAPLLVYVVNYPLQYFTERIGGPEVRVVFPAPADADPAFWRPKSEQIIAYQKADLILLNGAGYAKWVSSATLPASRVVDTSSSFSDRFIALKQKTSHSHGSTGQHEHGDVAFTTWLDPGQAILQARAIRDALVRLRPGRAGELNRNFNALSMDLQSLGRQITEVVTNGVSRPMIFSHPVYQYLIRRYNLEAQELLWEPDEKPTPGQWAELKQILVNHPAKVMLWEKAPDPTTVEQLRETGLYSLTFDPCGNVPAKGNYLSVMEKNIANLKVAFSR